MGPARGSLALSWGSVPAGAGPACARGCLAAACGSAFLGYLPPPVSTGPCPGISWWPGRGTLLSGALVRQPPACQRPWGARSDRCLVPWAPLASPLQEEDAGKGVCLLILLLGHELPWAGCSYTCNVGQFLRPPGSCSPLALLLFSSGTPLAKGTNFPTVPAATRRSRARQTRGSGRTRTAARSAVPAPPPPPTRKTGSSATAATVSSSATMR